MKTSSAKAKGRRLQQWVVERLSDITGIAFGENEQIQSRGMGQHGTDIMLVGDARNMIPFDIECKCHETWSVPAYIEQAKSNTKTGRDWLVVMSKNRAKPVVVLDAVVFFNILKKSIKK